MNIRSIASLLVMLLTTSHVLADAPTTAPIAAPTTQATNNAIVPVPKLESDSYNWDARHQAVLALQKKMSPQIVMIGDSITHFWGGEPAGNARGPKAWAKLFKDRIVINMGFGWDRTQNVLWRLDHGEFKGLQPKVVVLNIGTNNFSKTKNARDNTPAEVAEGIEAIIQRLHDESPKTKIILMAVFPRGQKPTDPYRARIAALNELLAKIPSKSDFVHLLDLTTQFLDADGNASKKWMSDYLHPTEEGYARWADALEPIFAAQLSDRVPATAPSK